QSEKRAVFCAHGHAESSHFDQAAREQCRFGIVAEFQSVTNSGANSNYVFQSAGQFHTYDVEIRVNAESIRGENILNPDSEFLINTSNDQRRGLAAADFLGMAWPAQCGHRSDSQHFLQNLRWALKGVILQTFGQA